MSIAIFKLKGGEPILVESQALESNSPLIKTGNIISSETLVEAALNFEDALDPIKPIAETIITKLSNLTSPPDVATIEFGINLKTDANAVVVSAGANANFKINLTWKKGNKINI